MIALRGKLERVDGNEGGASESPPSESASSSSSWRWKGQWAFGTKLGGKGPTTKALPFEYSWKRCVDPRTVEVPSARNDPNDAAVEAEEEATEEQQDAQELEKMDESGPEETIITEAAAATATNSHENKETLQGSAETGTVTPKSKQEEKDSKAAAALGGKESDGKDETATLNTVPADEGKQDVVGAETKEQEKGVDTPAAAATASGETPTAKDPPKTSTTTTTTTTTTPSKNTTFADTTDKDDPPFTDAATKYNSMEVPPSGEWMGRFETMGPRKGSGTTPVQETFCLFLNATPSADARIAFVDDDAAGNPVKDAQTMLPAGHIQARGVGENKYGTFELLGHLNVETGILECQRMYVATTIAATAGTGTGSSTTTPRTTLSRSRSSSRTKSSSATAGGSGERSYVTRKRQLSWKRRAAMEGETDVEAKARRGSTGSAGAAGIQPATGTTSVIAGTASATTGGSGGGRSGKKRARIDPMVTVVPSGSGVQGSTMAPPTGISMTLPQQLSATATATAAANTSTSTAQAADVAAASKRSAQTTSPLLHGGGATKKRVPASGASGGTNNRNSSGAGGGASSSSSSSGHMKLPAAGTPSHARWRAAHFLYYQRNDPSMEDGGSGGGSGGGGTTSGNTNAAPPRYVVYEGELLNSMREGRGVCLYNNGTLYEGEWKRNKEHGHGVLRSERKRIIYKGEWDRGRIHGHGTYYYNAQSPKEERNSNSKKGQGQSGAGTGGSASKKQVVPAVGGSRYEGDFKENLRHGMGAYVLPDGSVYSGQWREGMMSGRGVFTWPDGVAVYDGEWKDGKRHGLGLLKTADGFSYDGMWVQNSMEGRGSAIYPNGQQYNGLFSNGRREGRGTILFPNGAVYEGRFRDDAVDGQGTMKMHRTLVVPRTSDTDTMLAEDDDGTGDAKMEDSAKVDAKDDFMIPLYFQSDIGHIHRKAGFTGIGE